jgi:superfamily II DNA or RNA helicase
VQLQRGHHPVLQLATGTGKSLIIAELAERYRRAGQQVWALTHVQQLVAQNAERYRAYAGREPSIVCAGLNRKDTEGGVTFGTIQSVTGMLPELEAPDLIIIDEAHRVPHNEDEPTLYESILRRYPAAQRVAMTATPWRMDNGIIYGAGEQFWFDRLAYNYTVPRAVAEGWLCPLVGVETAVQLDVEEVSVAGDFTQSEVAELQNSVWLKAVARSLPELAGLRNHVAVYCPTVAAANLTALTIRLNIGWKSAVLHGGMTQEEREKTLNRFYSGEVRVLCSVDMITTGFDFPALDCIVCLRPTLSSSLWVQIQGRGTRLHPSKKNCLVLDYVGNLIRLGGVGMYETFYRERGMLEVPAEPSKPYVKRERKIYPGVRTLTPIDPMTGRVACYAMVGIMDDKLAEYTESAEAATDDAERALIQSIMRVLGGEDVRLVTWNGIGFDLPFIYKRALILDVYPAHFGAPPLASWTKRYSTERHYDLMQVWGGWSSQGFEKLDTVAALVLAERKVAIDVTTFADLMESAEGRAKMEEYCLQDTRLTWRLFEKMNKILFA